MSCLPLTIKVIHNIWLTDTSRNIQFGLEHMHTFILVSRYLDLYSRTKPFFLHLGLFRFADKSGSIFYDLIFLFYFFFHFISLIQYGFNSGCAFIVYKPGFLYDCYLFYMDVSCTLWFCHSSRTYLTAGSFLMQSEQKRRAVKFKWGNERAKLHDRLPPIKNESI